MAIIEIRNVALKECILNPGWSIPYPVTGSDEKPACMLVAKSASNNSYDTGIGRNLTVHP